MIYYFLAGFLSSLITLWLKDGGLADSAKRQHPVLIRGKDYYIVPRHVYVDLQKAKAIVSIRSEHEGE